MGSMNDRRRSLSLFLVAVLLSSFVPPSVQANDALSVSISTHWVGEGATDTAHASAMAHAMAWRSSVTR